ncbi:MAG: hypothetical protein EXR05_06035 [Acetobacteraceae bacterium]|nr:hypothetical protein [Acetobacteraceae bacterium]
MLPTETDLAAILARTGLRLTVAQMQSLPLGVAIIQEMIDRVNKPLPREAEPAVMFRPDQV